MLKKYYYLGICFVFVYLLTVWIGNLLVYSNYNPLINPISAFPLYMQKEKFAFIYTLFIFNNFMLFLFSLISIKKIKNTKYQSFKSPFIFIIIQTIVSSLIYIFPMSERGEPMTYNGFIHLSLFSICIITIAIAMFLFIKICYKMKLKRYFYLYIVLGILLVLFASLTTLGSLSILIFFGLYLRFLIDVFLIFILILSVMMKKLLP